MLLVLPACKDEGPPQQTTAPPVPPVRTAPPLVSLIGKDWDAVRHELDALGVKIQDSYVAPEYSKDGHLQFILRPSFARVMVRDGRIDEVEAWAQNRLAPHFSTVSGVVAPDVSVERIERVHGPPVYQAYGKHGLSMKGWRIDDTLVFVTSNNGMMLTPRVGRVVAFRQGHLPPPGRLWSLKGRITLQELADGRRYVETGLGRRPE